MNSKWKVVCILCLLFIASYAKYSGEKQRVCVIGAGVSGLVSADKLSDNLDAFEPIVFEKNSDIGGQWLYTDRTDVDEHGLPVHSNVYKYMRANGPKQLQSFPDYLDFQGENRSYVRHETMLEYLRNYTEHFDLRRFIRFDTYVEKVSSKPNNKWHMELRNLNTNERSEITCDAAIVGTGNFHKPNIPTIPGIESFPGRVLHSGKYRVPEEFADQTVVVLGASFSGEDIGIQISDYAKKVYLSHRHDKMNIELPKNMMEAPGVVSANGSELILSDGSKITADSLILCTGYLYDYPVLDASTGISVEKGKYVKPLYKHLINVEHPSMAIFGLPHPGFPFLIPYVQAQYFVALLEGKIKLPGYREMLKDAELAKNTPVSKAHFMGLKEVIPYYNELAIEAGADTMPIAIQRAFTMYYEQLLGDPLHLKDRDLFIYDDDHIEFVERH